MNSIKEKNEKFFKSRKEIVYLLILVIIPLIVFILRTSNGYLAGAKMDWLDQHSVFPDYFRKLFYKTGNLFPEYAPELGGGQNIYNFAYYGLFNPLYLISYLFPFIKMSVYIQIISLMEHIADGIICYIWLKGRRFSKEESFFASAVLVLAAPVIFHSSTQLMFVNYIPFLLLALIGYDHYCEHGKYGLYAGSVLVMILSSFYFAVGGMAVIFIYGVTGYKWKRNMTPIKIIKDLWHQFYPALLGCMLSVFYLAPVYFAMTAGRDDKAEISLKELFWPDMGMKKLLYSPYGIGLTVAAFVILCICLFYKRCREKSIAVWLFILFLFPVFNWLLNGGLYMRSKAFIPFLPLMCWLCADFFRRINKKKLLIWQALGGYILALVLVFTWGKVEEYGSTKQFYIFIDFIIFAVILSISLSVWKYAAGLGMITVMGIMGIIQIDSYKGSMVTEQFMAGVENTDIEKAVSLVLKDNKEFYRTEVRKGYDENKANQNRVCEPNQNLTTVYSSVENSDYQNFRDNTLNLSRPSRNKLMETASDNPVFLRLMGVRYIIGNGAPADYEKIGGVGLEQIYENKKAAPTAYVTDQVIKESDFLKLSYPERQMTLLKAAVAEARQGIKSRPENLDIVNCKADIEEEKSDKLTIEKTEQGFKIQADEISSRSISLTSQSRAYGYLFVTFDIKNNKPSKDVVITVNGERNKLSSQKAAYYNDNTTFHYASSISEETKEVPVVFGKGDYEIRNIKVWMGFENPRDAKVLYREPVKLKIEGNGNILEGISKTEKGGWLITSIPYDEEFKVLLDGKQVKIEKVNTGFAGIQMPKGEHTVKFVYHSKGMKEGMLVSLITLLIICADYVRRKFNIC